MSNVEKYVPPNNNSNEQTVEKLGNEAFIQAGNYCRPLTDVETDVKGEHSVIKAGEVLLIQRLKYAHDLVHAVIVRPHPRYFKDGHHPSFYSFLFEDFLDKFEILSMQEGNTVRTKEMQGLQNYISEQQKELFEIQSNPQRMMQIAMDIYSRRIEHKTEDQFIPTGDNLNVVDVIEAGVSPALINQIKASTNKQRDIAQIQAQWLTDQQKRLQDMFAAVLPYGTEMAAAQTSSIQDVTDSIDKMMSGIATLELYTGEDVFVYTVKEGEPAPDGLPLTVMQERLYGDVELSLFTEKAVKLDYRNRHLLWDEFKTNQAFVDQVFPTERCIVLMCCNRNSKDYGNAYENASRNHDNKEVFLLVRNGENIHAVYSSISTHLHSSRLFPSKVELERHFYNESKKIVIDINDLKYSDRLSQVEAEALHYRRFMILIAGLDHREKLFGNFYPEQSPLNIFYPEFQNKYMNFIHDIDGEGMLPTQEEKRPSLFEFLMHSNSQIRKGSRIVVQTHLLLTHENAPACFSYKKGEYECNYFPDEEYLFANVEKDSKGFFIKVPVHPKWNTKKRSFNARFAIPVSLEPETLLCIDHVSPAELEFYITSRVHRHHFVRYLEMFKAARQYIVNQHDSLKEVRSFLEDAAQHVPDSKIKDKTEQAKIISDVLNAWVCANNGKVVLDKDGMIGKDTRTALLNQLYFRMSNEFVQRYEYWVEKALSSLTNQTPLKLAVDFDGSVWLYTTIAPESQLNAIEPNRFVARHQLNMVAKARNPVKKTLFVLPDQYSIDEYVVKQWDELESVVPFNNKTYELNGQTHTYLFKDYESKHNFTKYVQMGQDLLQKFYSNSFTIDDAELLLDAYFEEYKRQLKSSDYGYASPHLFFPLFSLHSRLYVVSVSETLELVYALVNKFNLYEYVEDNCGYTLKYDPQKTTYSFKVRGRYVNFGAGYDRHIVREYLPQYDLKTMLADQRIYTVLYTNSRYEGGKDHGLLSYVPYQVSIDNKVDFEKPETLANIYTSLDVSLMADYNNLSIDRAFNNPLLTNGMAFRSSSFIVHSVIDPETKEIKSSRIYLLVGSAQDYSKNHQMFMENHDMTGKTKEGEDVSVYSRYGFMQYDEIEEYWEKHLKDINKAFYSSEKQIKACVEMAGLTAIRTMKIIQEDEGFLALST